MPRGLKLYHYRRKLSIARACGTRVKSTYVFAAPQFEPGWLVADPRPRIVGPVAHAGARSRVVSSGNSAAADDAARKCSTVAGTAVDVVFVTGDAYVDHPSFAMALLGRLLESEGFRVAISQPARLAQSCEPWRTFGRPRLFFAVSAGNMDSMINHYTANRKVRNDDAYSPGGQIGRRPDRATLGLLPAGSRGLQGRAGDRRRRRGQPAAPRPLRLLERQSPPVDLAGLQSRPAGVRHGRAGDRRNRPPAGGRTKRSRDLRDLRGVAYRLGSEGNRRRRDEHARRFPATSSVLDRPAGLLPR